MVQARVVTTDNIENPSPPAIDPKTTGNAAKSEWREPSGILIFIASVHLYVSTMYAGV